MSKLWQLTASDIAAQTNNKTVSATEVARSALERLHQINPKLNAVIQHNDKWTLEQAQLVDQRIANGEKLPLAGVPITVKDNIWVKGQTITQGSLLFKDFVAPQDAWAVARLKELGAVIIGITNCSEFACKGISNNLVYGKTRSPWDLERTPGGSSGGAVSAVAAGIGALALGTDAGGSIRRPAAHCGLVGMKPTFGLVPCGPGFDEPNFGLSVNGQIARTVDDAALMWRHLVQFKHSDWGSQLHKSAETQSPLSQAPSKKLRIAYSHDLGCNFAIDEDVRAVVERAVNALEKDGYQVELAAPVWPQGVHTYPLLKLQQAGLAALHGKAYDADPSQIDPDIAAQIVLGRGYSAVEIAEVLILREHIYAAYARFFEQFDVLLCPTTPTVSWSVNELGPKIIGGREAGPRGHAVYTPLFNYSQAPACTVPVGLARGLPVGLQIVGSRYQDPLVLQMAKHFERLGEGQPKPALWAE
jgi:aspartyl-tRNA(Asn)/glutamyl-tRNA(Gln) amidotransferase subunit A